MSGILTHALLQAGAHGGFYLDVSVRAAEDRRHCKRQNDGPDGTTVTKLKPAPLRPIFVSALRPKSIRRLRCNIFRHQRWYT